MKKKKKPKKNSEYFWKVCPSPTGRSRNIACPKCGQPKHKRQECVYCNAVKEWEKLHKRPFPGVAGDGHGKATRQLNSMVGVSN
jgi:hypothetical protein